MYIKTVSFIMSYELVNYWLTGNLLSNPPNPTFRRLHNLQIRFLTCLLHNIYDKSLPVYHADNYIYTEVIDIFYFIYFLQSN